MAVTLRKLDEVAAELTTRRVRLTAAAVSRIVLGAAGVHYYLSGYGLRRFLWGPDSYLEHTVFTESVRARGTFSLYALGDSIGWFELVFHGGLITAAAFMVVGGRTLTAAHAVFVWSLYERSPTLTDGGDNFARIAVLLLLLVTTHARYSPGAAARAARLASSTAPSWGATIHNTGVVLMVVQTAFVYQTAALWKIAGPLWREGTALWYASRIDDYAFAPLLSAAFANPFVVVSASYAVIFVQAVFLALVLTRRFRLVAVAGVAAMHAGIAVTMGLVGFGLSMSSGLAMAFSERHYDGLRALGARAAVAARAVARRSRSAEGAEEPVGTRGLHVEPSDGD